MKTFNAWLIANVETVTTVLLIVFYELWYFTGGDEVLKFNSTAAGAVLGLLLMPLMKIAVGGYPSRNTFADFFNLLIAVVVYTLIFVVAHNVAALHGMIAPAVVVALVSLMMAVIASVFTGRHMDEVVTLRMLYVNSNVDMFELKWKYTINRFTATFCGVSGLGLAALLLINVEYIIKVW